MNAVQRPRSQGDSRTKAREWFVRLLDDDVSPEDLALCGEWLDAEPANRAAYDEVYEAWSLAGPAHPSRPSDDELRQDAYDGTLPVARWRVARKPTLRVIWPAVGAAVLLLCGAGFWALTRGDVAEPQQFATARAQQLSANLPDGSRLHLAAMSTVKVSYSSDRRNIELEKGEVLFDVAKDAKRRFVVDTPMGAITAVGTTFDVDVRERLVSLYVSEGVVRVDFKKANRGEIDGPVLTVVAGQQVRMERAGSRILVVQREGTSLRTWREGRLEYRDEPLRFVVEEVNRYAPHAIIIADAALENLTYTGTVRLDSTEDWVKGLQDAFPIKVVVNDQQQLVLKRKSQRPPPSRRPTAT